MKLYKYFAFALAMLSLSACDDNKVEDYPGFLGAVNTASDVTVDLDPTFSFNENQTMVYVPVNVSGTTNGKIVVTVEVKEAVENPAKEVENYNITSKTINIPEGEATGYVEITPVWEQGVINDDRKFSMTITKVEGATVGNANCDLTIVNVDDAYTMMAGSWTLTATEVLAGNVLGNEVTMVLNMKTLEPNSEHYGTELDAFNLKGLSYLYIPFAFNYDEASKEISLELMAGSFATTGIINFTGIGECIVASSTAFPDLGDNVPLELVGYDEIIFPEDLTFTLAVMPYPALNQILGSWGKWTKMHMTRN